MFQGAGKLGYSIDVLPDEKFFSLLQERKRTEEGREQLQGLMTNELSKGRQDIPVLQDATNQYLEDLKSGWSAITEAYLDKYLSALSGMDLF